jgi:hypothetical protein
MIASNEDVRASTAVGGWRSPWLIPVWAGLLVFVLNNFLLARLLTSLPGGTALAPTMTAALAFVALRLRRPGGVTLVYATYGVLGILGHLGVDASTYAVHYVRPLLAALAFDAIVTLARFRPWALAPAMVACAAVLWSGAGLTVQAWATVMALGGAGLLLGVLLGRARHP